MAKLEVAARLITPVSPSRIHRMSLALAAASIVAIIVAIILRQSYGVVLWMLLTFSAAPLWAPLLARLFSRSWRTRRTSISICEGHIALHANTSKLTILDERVVRGLYAAEHAGYHCLLFTCWHEPASQVLLLESASQATAIAMAVSAPRGGTGRFVVPLWRLRQTLARRAMPFAVGIAAVALATSGGGSLIAFPALIFATLASAWNLIVTDYLTQAVIDETGITINNQQWRFESGTAVGGDRACIRVQAPSIPLPTPAPAELAFDVGTTEGPIVMMLVRRMLEDKLVHRERRADATYR